jgi:eukaryotic-like serine/threonine-protein kinase
MPLTSGTKLGPYEIHAPLGAGGMGEVYRARDARLNREVAIKILPASFSADPDRLQRFAQESRAAAALNHPNILSIYDIGDDNGMPYVVSELLQGESLRERLLRGVIPSRKALDYAQQIAKGLAAAHDRGIVHRDLKPENLFLTNDGRVKILDFGLAKFTRPDGGNSDEVPTMQVATELGTVLGTVGYMSPEQVRGKPADARSDIFSFGAILYEMLSGKRAFRGDSSADTMSAILKEDPADLTETNRNVSPALERIVRHCLEKSPADRFQSAPDLAFHLESLGNVSGASHGAIQALSAPKLRRRWWLAAIAGLLLLAAWAGGYQYASRSGGTQNPNFHEVTFRNGTVWAARFAPDGQSIVYSAAWEGRPHEVFSTRFDSSDSRPMDLPSALVLAVSSKGEMAIGMHPVDISPFQRSGTLARVALAGGAPREVLEDVSWADWTPDGQSLAAVHGNSPLEVTNGLEFPLGNVIYKPNGWVSHVRFSPKGDFLAIADHIPTGDDGRVAIIDRHGNHKTNSSFYTSVEGLAWAPDGKEVWFSAVPAGSSRAIYALDLSGKERLIYRAPSGLTIQDISHNGLVLLTADKVRIGISALVQPESRERSLSWFDWSVVSDISADGKAIIFSETGEAVGASYGIYLRNTDGSPAIRLGDGNGGWFSPDGHWVLATAGSPTKLALLPIGVGAPRPLIDAKMDVTEAGWLPDGKSVVYSGIEEGTPRTYFLDLQVGTPHPITPAGFYGSATTPDGRFVLVRDGNHQCWMYPVSGGEPKKLNFALKPNEFVLRFFDQGRSVLVRTANVPAEVFRVDIATGRRDLWKQVAPADPAGVQTIAGMVFSGDGKSYAYSVSRMLSDLYVVSGLH